MSFKKKTLDEKMEKYVKMAKSKNLISINI